MRVGVRARVGVIQKVVRVYKDDIKNKQALRLLQVGSKDIDA